MQFRFNLASSQTAFIINYVTLIMGQDAAKSWFLSVIFLVSSLVLKYHLFCTLSMVMTLVSLINTKTKEYFLADIYTFGL